MGFGEARCVHFHKILVPVDFSDASERAFLFALGLARSLGAELCLLHAYSIPSFDFVPEGAFLPPASLVASIQERAQTRLDALAARASGVPCTTDLLGGEPVPLILDAAQRKGADLLVLGTHGSGLFKRILLGSVAAKVLRLSPVPVITVRGSREERLQAEPERGASPSLTPPTVRTPGASPPAEAS